MPTTSLLAISGINLADYAVRGLSQTLEAIGGRALRRDINGTLVDVTPTQFRKYKSTISCTDQAGPGLVGVWPGQQVTVTCLPDVLGGDSTPLVLTMLVVSYRSSRDEYGASVGWELELEEE